MYIINSRRFRILFSVVILIAEEYIQLGSWVIEFPFPESSDEARVLRVLREQVVVCKIVDAGFNEYMVYQRCWAANRNGCQCFLNLFCIST